MLAPIALYPDPLLSQILMAATYPLEIVEAARWVRANPGLRGDEAVRAVAEQSWDPSVKSLVAFPQILALMDQRLDWTQRLGNAVLAQQAQVMDTVQALRARADNAGNLRSSDRIRVENLGGSIALVPVNPQVVYVPYYDPLTIYGPWWWPNYPPVYWPAWPGYYAGPGLAVGLAWGIGVAIAAEFFFGAFDWPHHRFHVTSVSPYYYRPGRTNVAPGPWQHDADHRRGVPYRGDAVRQQYRRPVAPSVIDSRNEFRGRRPQFGEPGARPGATAPTAPTMRPQAAPAAPRERPQAAPAARPQATPIAPAARPQAAQIAPAARPQAVPIAPAARPQATPTAPAARPQVTPPAPAARPQAAAPAMRPQARVAAPEPTPRAFEGIQSGGAQTRQYSARGQASMQQPRAAPAPRPAPAKAAPAGGGQQRR